MNIDPLMLLFSFSLGALSGGFGGYFLAQFQNMRRQR